jgi:hypothetical protein
MSPRLHNVIVVVVLAVWVTNFAARFLVPGYEPAPQIDAIFMAIAGGAIALHRKGSKEADSEP